MLAKPDVIGVIERQIKSAQDELGELNEGLISKEDMLLRLEVRLKEEKVSEVKELLANVKEDLANCLAEEAAAYRRYYRRYDLAALRRVFDQYQELEKQKDLLEARLKEIGNDVPSPESPAFSSAVCAIECQIKSVQDKLRLMKEQIISKEGMLVQLQDRLNEEKATEVKELLKTLANVKVDIANCWSEFGKECFLNNRVALGRVLVQWEEITKHKDCWRRGSRKSAYCCLLRGKRMRLGAQIRRILV